MIVQSLYSDQKKTTSTSRGVVQPLIPTSQPIVQKPSQVKAQETKKTNIVTKTVDTIKGLDLKELGKSFVAGAKSLPGVIKQAGGIIVSNYITSAKKQQEMAFKIQSKITPKAFETYKEKSADLLGKQDKTVKKIEEVALNLRESGVKSQVKAQEEYYKTKKEPANNLQKLLESVAFNTPQVLASTGLAVATAYVTKNPALAMTVGLTTSYGLGASEVYSEARQNGLSDKQSINLATAGGLIIGALDFVPAERLIRKTGVIEPIKKTLIKKIASAMVSTAIQSGTEGVTEGLQEIVGNALAQTYNENKNLFEGVTEAMFVGAILGGGANVTVEGINTMIRKVEQQVSKTLEKPKEKRSIEEQKLVDTLLNQEMTPDQAMSYVLENELGNTEIGKTIVRLVAQAKQENKIIKISPNEDETGINIELSKPGVVKNVENVVEEKTEGLKSITEGREAEKLAREGAETIVEKNVTKAGLYDTYYRGATNDKLGGFSGTGTFLTKDKGYAETFAGKTGKVYEFKVDRNKLKVQKSVAPLNEMVAKEPWEFTDDLVERPQDFKPQIEELKRRGINAIESFDGRQTLILDENVLKPNVAQQPSTKAGLYDTFENIYKNTKPDYAQETMYARTEPIELLKIRRELYDNIANNSTNTQVLQDTAGEIKAIESILRNKNIQLNDYIKQLKFGEVKSAMEAKLPKDEYIAKNKLSIKSTTKINPELESMFGGNVAQQPNRLVQGIESVGEASKRVDNFISNNVGKTLEYKGIKVKVLPLEEGKLGRVQLMEDAPKYGLRKGATEPLMLSDWETLVAQQPSIKAGMYDIKVKPINPKATRFGQYALGDNEFFGKVEYVKPETLTGGQGFVDSKIVNQKIADIKAGKPINPIIVKDGQVIDGYHTAEALTQLGYKELPVVEVKNTLDVSNVAQQPSTKAGLYDAKPVTVKVYHGTSDIAKGGTSGHRTADVGQWFTSDKKVAGEFADWTSFGGNKGKPVVKEETLTFKKPKVYESNNEWDSWQLFRKDFDKYRTYTQFPNQYEGVTSLRVKDPETAYWKALDKRNISGINDVYNIEGFVNDLKKQGYDGIILKDSLVDAAGNKPHTQYIKFREQKSVAQQPLSVPVKPKGGKAYASTGSTTIGKFEKINTKNSESGNFKLHEKVKGLIEKYAKTVGEGYTPRKALGVYYPDTTNLRVNGMNNLSVASHEITHFLDFHYKISNLIRGIKGYAKNGNPIYDPKTKTFRKEITNVYLKYYPGAKEDHPLLQRTTEGFATLLQKYIEIPTTIKNEYPTLVKEFLEEGGKFYKPVMGEIKKDLQNIVAEYQGLDALDKVGARITSDKANVDKTDFLNLGEKIRTFVADSVYPIELLAKRSGKAFTQNDPSLWVRFYNNSNQVIFNNIYGNKGFYGFRDGEFVKLYDFNYKTLIDILAKEKNVDSFSYYLVARDQHFNYLELDVLKQKAETLAKQVKQVGAREAKFTKNSDGVSLMDEAKQAINAYKDLAMQLENNGFTREEVFEAYTQNKNRFIEEEKMFDALVKEDIEFLSSEEVQLVKPGDKERLLSKEGYASLKREFYDEIAGEETYTGVAKVGKTKVSALIRRKGSARTIINPVYSALTNHSEATKKGLKQIVYNKIGDIAYSAHFPELFQTLQLQVVPQETGVISYPQEKDPHIIMARKDFKRLPILTDNVIKQTIDDVLTHQNISIFEQLLLGSSRFFTKGTTGLFPQFALANYAVDQITASAQTMNNYIPLYTPLNEIVKTLHDKGGANSKYFIEYMVLGGEKQTFVGWQDMSPNELFSKIRNERNGLVKVVDLLNKGMDVLAIPSKYSEIATRASEYIKARQAGKPQVVALEEAGRVTAPFHHVGKLGGRVGQTFVKSIPFFNPAIQVLDQSIRTIQSPVGRKRFAFVAFAVTASLVSSFGLLMAMGTKEQKELYRDLEPDELSKYIWLPNPKNGEQLLKVRIPEQMGIFGVAMNMYLANQLLGARYNIADFVEAGTSFLPSQFDITNPTRAFLSWVPQIFKPGIMTIAGVKDYPNVMPLESQTLKNLPAKYRYTESTSEFAKWLGDKINMSPIKIDYLLTGYLGRASGFITGKKGVYNPFSSVVRNYYFSSGRTVSDFYDLKEKNDQLYKEIIPNKEGKVIRKAPIEERSRVKKIKDQTDNISDLLSEYRKLDIEKDPDKARRIREKIIEAIDKLNGGDKKKISLNFIKTAYASEKPSVKDKLSFKAIDNGDGTFDIDYGNGSISTIDKSEVDLYRSLVERHNLESNTIGEASYYNPKNPSETRANTDGTGAYGRKIQSGSVAFGNRIFHDELKQGKKIYIKVKGFDKVKTPYGNGVFRIDDTMNIRYNKPFKYNIDFNASDLDQIAKKKGRFPIMFEVVKIE